MKHSNEAHAAMKHSNEALKHRKNHKHSFLTFALIQEEQLLLRGTAATTMLTHAHPIR